MRHIYKSIQVSIPSEAKISYTDRRVFVDRIDPSSGKKRRIKIGNYLSEGLMNPNDNFKRLFPNAFTQAGGTVEDHAESRLDCGVFAAVLGIAHKIGLYRALIDAYGAVISNKILDLVCYSLIYGDNVAQKFPESMRKCVLFSGLHPMSDTTIGQLYNKEMNEEQTEQFKSRWLQRCVNEKITDAWIAVDGSNSDCKAEAVELAATGNAKSGNNVPVVSYLCAVATPSGMPITYSVYHGNVPDLSAWVPVNERLKAAGVSVKGFIFDRGFISQELVQSALHLNYTYVAMLKSDCYGYQWMLNKYSEQLFWKPQYLIRQSGDFFGLSDQCRLFKSSPLKANVSLYFDAKNGCERSITQNKKILRAIDSAKGKIAKGQKPSIASEFSEFIQVQQDEQTGKYRLHIDYDSWEKIVLQKGYSAIATNGSLTAAETDKIYGLRTTVEKDFSIMKSQLGIDALRGHFTNGVRSRIDVCFIAGIIRCELMNICQKLGYDTNQIIGELQRVHFELLNDSYCYIDKLTTRQKDVLKQAGIGKEELETLAERLNKSFKNKDLYNNEHPMPGNGWPKNTQKDSEINEQIKKKKIGRPLGSKNKKTLEREALQKTQPSKVIEHPGRGRKKGSKNKKTLEREEYERTHPKPAKKIGRPKGSKNKKTLEREARERAEYAKKIEALLLRSAGRPAGSKNKKTLEKELELAKTTPRSPGRPKGSKNKKTLLLEKRRERELLNEVRKEKRRRKQAIKNLRSTT